MHDVVWLTFNPESITRGFWDQGVLEHFFAGALWPHGMEFVHHEARAHMPDIPEAIVVIPARHNVEHVDRINAELGRLTRCVVFLTGDEEGVFPFESLTHPDMKLWVQTPHRPTDRGFGDFWPPWFPAQIPEDTTKNLEWVFLGQANNASRESCVRVLGHTWRQRGGSKLLATKAFTAGLEPEKYAALLARAKVAPAPSGTFTPDTFRLFEALEAGCIPVAERRAPKGDQDDYWDSVLGDVPFPVIDQWEGFAALLDRLLAQWPANANVVSAWWQNYKRDLALRMLDDIGWESKGFTVLVPTSPSPLHPATYHIDTVLGSIRDRTDAEIIVMLDGVREEQAHRADAYEEYRRRVIWHCEHHFDGVIPLYFDEHMHQANVTRAALELVHTPAVLFVEHDTPLVGDIPFDELQAPIDAGELDVIRLHHEAQILDAHRHLMVDPEPHLKYGPPLQRTVQWSQRPHLASTEFYRRIINTYFGSRSRTFIEDAMHGVVSTHHREMGMDGWEKFRLAIYNPGGDIRRSGHLDSRGDDPKFEMKFEYDGETPWGAPRATSERVD